MRKCRGTGCGAFGPGIAGRVDKAINHFLAEASARRRDPLPRSVLARVYATHPSPEIRNGPEAVRLAAFLETPSAAYAEAGRLEEAVHAAGEARTKALAEMA